MADTMEHKKLIEYLPAFMQQFVEMKEIMKMEDIEVDRIESNIQKVLDNAFMKDCDEDGIKKYEKLLHITPDKEDTLESRRTRVLLRWNDTLPYTWKTLKRKLDLYCGANQYVIKNDLEHYRIHLHTYFYQRWQMDELKEILEPMLPMNIMLAYLNTMIFTENANISGLEKVLVENLCFCMKLKESVKETMTSVKIRMPPVFLSESIEASVTILKNAWYFDGAFNFDGERQFNAEVKKEVL